MLISDKGHRETENARDNIIIITTPDEIVLKWLNIFLNKAKNS